MLTKYSVAPDLPLEQLYSDMQNMFQFVRKWEVDGECTIRTPLTGVDNDFIEIQAELVGDGGNRFRLNDGGETYSNLFLRGQQPDMDVIATIMRGLDGRVETRGEVLELAEDLARGNVVVDHTRLEKYGKGEGDGFQLVKYAIDYNLAADIARLANAVVAVEYAHYIP